MMLLGDAKKMTESIVKALRRARSPDSRSRIPAAAAIGAGDDLEQVTVGVFEVEPAAAVVVIDLPPRRLTGIGPVGKLPVADSCEDLVEFCFIDQEGVVLRHDLFLDLHVVEVGSVLGRDHVERTPMRGGRQAEHFGQEPGRGLTVAGRQDGVIELNRHVVLFASARSNLLSSVCALNSRRIVAIFLTARKSRAPRATGNYCKLGADNGNLEAALKRRRGDAHESNYSDRFMRRISDHSFRASRVGARVQPAPFYQRIPVGPLWLVDVVRLLLSGSRFARPLRSSKARDSYETWTHWDLGLACHRRCLFLRGYLPS